MKKHYNVYEIFIYYAAFSLRVSGKATPVTVHPGKKIPRLSPGDAVKIYFSSSVQSRVSRSSVHFSNLFSLVL